MRFVCAALTKPVIYYYYLELHQRRRLDLDLDLDPYPFLPSTTATAPIPTANHCHYHYELPRIATRRGQRPDDEQNEGRPAFEAIMTTPTMAQPTAIHANGTSESPTLDKAQPVAPGKRKRDVEEEDRDEDMISPEQKPAITNGEPKKDQRDLIKSFVDVLSRYACFF